MSRRRESSGSEAPGRFPRRNQRHWRHFRQRDRVAERIRCCWPWGSAMASTSRQRSAHL